MSENPFSQPSSLPMQAPPFDRIEEQHYLPALRAGIAEKRRQVNAIADWKEPASFSNTFEALERSGALLNRVNAVFSAMTSANTSPALQEIDETISPELAALDDEIMLNSKLFARLDSVYQQRHQLALDPESLRLTEVVWRAFQLAGASLSEQQKTELKALNQEAATLSTRFGNRLLAATKAGGLTVNDAAMLAGLSPSELAAAAEAATAKGLHGQWLLALQNTTQQPLLQSLSRRDTREALFTAAWHRAEKGDDNDTQQTLIRLAQVRAKQAALLGYGS